MVPLQCTNCRAPLAGDDAFCGMCGTQAEAIPGAGAGPGGDALPGLSARPGGQARAAGAGRPAGEGRARFFYHASSDPAQDRTGPAGNLTRYLCAAAYLDTAFTNRVIGELVASHRAVVPSTGIDLAPIIRHCLSARKMQLTRDVLLTVFLLCGLYLVTVPTIAIMVIAFAFGMLPRVNWARRSMGKAFLAGVSIVVLLVLIFGLWLIIRVANTAGSRSLAPLGPLASGAGVGLAVAALLILLTATSLVFYFTVFHTLSERLQPGAPAGSFAAADPRAESRIAEIDAAQCGNITLYDGENPFIGAGTRGRVWSIAIELDRAKGGDPTSWLRPDHGGYVAIDPVELHQTIKDRLRKLNDRDLPDNERISALTVHDHIVGESRHRWESPLIDPYRKIPYSQASQEAIDALIRHPQAGLRYYLQASVTDEGQAVRTGDQVVITPSDQEITVSAFVYVAVEGRMLYLEFVPATLPPIAQKYHVVDLLPKISSGQFLGKVLLHTMSSAFGDLIRAPFAMAGTLLRMLLEHLSYRSESAAAADYVFGEIGARVSVRELGAARSVSTYLQQLDAAKYTRIIERLITDTVLDFLTAKGADTTAYRNSALAVINSGVVISGGTINAPVAAGAYSVASTGASAAAPATTTPAH